MTKGFRTQCHLVFRGLSSGACDDTETGSSGETPLTTGTLLSHRVSRRRRGGAVQCAVCRPIAEPRGLVPVCPRSAALGLAPESRLGSGHDKPMELLAPFKFFPLFNIIIPWATSPHLLLLSALSGPFVSQIDSAPLSLILCICPMSLASCFLLLASCFYSLLFVFYSLARLALYPLFVDV